MEALLTQCITWYCLMLVAVSLESFVVRHEVRAHNIIDEEDQTDVVEMVKSISMPDAIVRPQDQAQLPSLRVAPEGAPILEAVHSRGSRFVLLESLPGMIATMPMLLMWVASCIWDVWKRSWPYIMATVCQASKLWRRESSHRSRKRIRAGDSLSGLSSELEGLSVSSVFAFSSDVSF